MAQFQVYKPKNPGESRQLQNDLFSGTEADLQARKDAGEDISYTQVGGDSASAPPSPSAGSPFSGGGTGQAGSSGGGGAPAPVAAAATNAPQPMQGLLAAGAPPEEGAAPLDRLVGAAGLRPTLATRRPPPLAGLLKAVVY